MGKKKGKTKKENADTRYNRKKPTVSFRVTAEIKEEIDRVRKLKGLSYADLVMIAKGKIEVAIRDEKVLWQQGYDKGLVDGLKRGRDRWGVPFHCDDCDQTAWVEKAEDKQELTDIINDLKDREHVGCPKKRPPRRGKPKGNGQQNVS